MTIQQVFAKHSNLTSLSDGDYGHMMDEEDFTNAAKELIEYHVKAALLQASKKSKVRVTSELDYDDNERAKRHIDYFEFNEKSILNSYTLDLIK